MMIMIEDLHSAFQILDIKILNLLQMSTGPGQVTDLASNITLPLTGLSSFRQQCQDKYADFDYKPGKYLTNQLIG